VFEKTPPIDDDDDMIKTLVVLAIKKSDMPAGTIWYQQLKKVMARRNFCWWRIRVSYKISTNLLMLWQRVMAKTLASKKL
jgi:hypothetical protein